MLTGVVLWCVPALALAGQSAVSMSANQFSPPNTVIYTGDTVVWTNHGTIAYTVTSDTGVFDIGPIQSGQSLGAIFNTPGTYRYYSKGQGGPNGQGMSGTVTVVASAQTTGTPVVVANTSVATQNTTQVTQLQAQLQALLNQISAIQGQTGATGATGTTGTVAYDSSSCPLIGRSLKVGSSGDDVLRLQRFLARDSSVYPEGSATGYYGALTEAAVKRWQVKYHIVSSGTPETTGYGVVGPRTAAAISILCTTGSYGGVAGPSGTSGAPVGGYITVTPISGQAPLTVNVTATINTTHSCAAATYTLDFGDGTVPQQIVQSGGTCGESSKTFTHVYPYAGTFQVKLSAGGHQTTATVVVSGVNAGTQLVCPSGFHAALVSGNYVCVQNQGTGTVDNSSYSYTPPVITPSQSDPLSFTMQFDLPSSCTGFDLDWGDGTQHATQSDGGSSCAQGKSIKSLTHTYATTGAYVMVLKRGSGLSRRDDISVTVQL